MEKNYPSQEVHSIEETLESVLEAKQLNLKESTPEKLNDEVHIQISVETKIPRLEETEKKNDEIHFDLKQDSNRFGRLIVLILAIALLIIGRYSVPNIEINCIKDEIIDLLKFANDFINAGGNEFFRDFFQVVCSFLVDTVFVITFWYWVMYGRNARLPLSLIVFYFTRAAIQKIWISPFPSGYYWESPGIPSLVVPYGRGSDFFFSGHSGFLVICASEWHKLNIPKMRNYVIGVTIYTILILLIYRIHYTIDIFTGVIFAEWAFCKIDLIKTEFSEQWTVMVSKLNRYFEYPNKNKLLINLSNKNQFNTEANDQVSN